MDPDLEGQEDMIAEGFDSLGRFEAQQLSSKRHPQGKTIFILTVLASLMIFGLNVFCAFSYTLDDTFISLHYSRSLAEGHGLTWNGVRTEGYTSMAWVIVGAAAHLAGDPVFMVKVFGVAFILLAGFIAGRIFIPNDLEFAGIPLAVFLTNPQTAVHAVSGMETAMAVAVLTAFVVSVYRSKGAWQLVFLGLVCVFVRPEFFMVTAPLLIHSLRTRREILLPLMTLFIIGLVYFLWRWQYFGLLFPLPFYIKQNIGFEGLEYVVDFFLENWAVVLFMPAILLVSVQKSNIFIASILLLSGYFLFVDPLMGWHGRFLYPVYPVLIALAVMVMVRAGNGIRAVGLVLLFIHFVSLNGRDTIEAAKRFGEVLDRVYVSMGKSLSPKTGTIALTDVGAIPYYSRWNTLDLVGLNDANIAFGANVDYVLRQDPDVIILSSKHPAEFQGYLTIEEQLYHAISQQYTLIRIIPLFQIKSLWYFQKNKSP